jgi:hypothetical protein
MGWEGGSGSVYETSILNLKYIYIINTKKKKKTFCIFTSRNPIWIKSKSAEQTILLSNPIYFILHLQLFEHFGFGSVIRKNNN